VLLVFLSLLACKRSSKETPEDTAAQAKQIERCEKVLKTIASLGTTPESFSTTSSNAEYELREKLAQSTFDSLADELSVTKK
jgi:hypothetical protein